MFFGPIVVMIVVLVVGPLGDGDRDGPGSDPVVPLVLVLELWYVFQYRFRYDTKRMKEEGW